MGTIKIAPSILAADFANLERDIQMVNQSEAISFTTNTTTPYTKHEL